MNCLSNCHTSVDSFAKPFLVGPTSSIHTLPLHFLFCHESWLPSSFSSYSQHHPSIHPLHASPLHIRANPLPKLWYKAWVSWINSQARLAATLPTVLNLNSTVVAQVAMASSRLTTSKTPTVAATVPTRAMVNSHRRIHNHNHPSHPLPLLPPLLHPQVPTRRSPRMTTVLCLKDGSSSGTTTTIVTFT